jgi:hypothetical protein
MAIEILPLDSAGWQEVESRLASRQKRSEITKNLLKHLRALKAQTAIVESDYLDRDFTEAYSSYYAKLFKKHTKHCTRLLFFSSDLKNLTQTRDPKDLALQLGTEGYLGQIVLRPIHEAPIAQVTLAAPAAPVGYEKHILVKAQHYAHALGAEFSMFGAAMTQQDQRIGACAQAAIWVALRHIHLRHRGPWFSMVNVSEAANVQVDAMVNKSLPSGSEFLSANGMIGALRAAGRKPLLYHATYPPKVPTTWTDIRPHEVINRYIDSGIPVIIGLAFQNSEMGHAVVATGQVISHAAPVSVPQKPTRAEFCEAFCVNDDQLGPNLSMPLRPGSPVTETPYNVQENVSFLLIPLPDKVFLPGEKAEHLAWDVLTEYQQWWPRFKQANAKHMGDSIALADHFIQEIAANNVIARTYLTYGWKYQIRAVRNNHTVEFKRIARSSELPRFVWVTEFGTLSSFSDTDIFKRRIFSHCVIDATAKNMGAESRLIFHAPGVAVCQAQDAAKSFGSYKLDEYALKDDTQYFPKLRGNVEFKGY